MANVAKTILASALASMLSLAALSQTKKPVPPTPKPIVWQQEPKTFRGVAWGTSEEDARAALKFGICNDPASNISGLKIRRCIFPFELGGVSVSGYLQFMNDKFVAAFGNFPSEEYQTVRAAVVQKYGPPMTATTPTASIRMKGPFEQLTWEGPGVVIVLNAEGFFHILTQEFRAVVSKAD